MNTLIKKYTPYFQFAAVVITIALGVHSLMEKLLADTGPAVTIYSESVHFKKQEHNKWYLGFSINLHRDDCVVSDKILKVEDADGFQYDVFSSNYRLANTDQSLPYGKKVLRKGKYDLYVVFYLEDDDHAKVKGKPVKFTGTFTHQCPEGQQLTVLPDHDNMTFTIE